MELTWVSDHNAALATFSSGKKLVPARTAAQLTGKDQRADLKVLRQFQTVLHPIHWMQASRLNHGLLDLRERPPLAAAPFVQPEGAAQETLAAIVDLEACLAAAFFERLEAGGGPALADAGTGLPVLRTRWTRAASLDSNGETGR